MCSASEGRKHLRRLNASFGIKGTLAYICSAVSATWCGFAIWKFQACSDD
jgi:hypothetical protein